MIDVEDIAIKAGMKVGTNLSGVRLVGSPYGTSIAHLTVDDIEELSNLILEEAAKVCDELADASNLVYAGVAASKCAAAIRMLKAK